MLPAPLCRQLPHHRPQIRLRLEADAGGAGQGGPMIAKSSFPSELRNVQRVDRLLPTLNWQFAYDSRAADLTLTSDSAPRGSHGGW
jgi:hypothetical protein